MSVGYKAVQWSRDKLIYDGILLAGVILYIATFINVSYRIEPPKDLPAAIDVRIRAFGTCAFFMLTIILSIGPLARINPWFHKLLFNRRHFGVLTFAVALLHAWFMIEWYEAQGTLPNLFAELTTWPD
jgi:DMSO/TMAO reductase YedYZ heme-binding membrane subunit